MSRSVIQCKGCRAVLATRHHSGRITVADGVKDVLVRTGVELRCRCGVKRIVRSQIQ